MDDEQLRLECLKLAHGDAKEAERMFSFIKRRGEFSSGALKGYAPPKDEETKARVVGRDGNLEKPFKDYLRKDDDK